MPALPRRKVTADDVTYDVYVCPDAHIHVDITVTGAPPLRLLLDDMAAYDLAQSLLRGFDYLNGIAEKD